MRAHLRVILEYSAFSKKQTQAAKVAGVEYKWEEWAQRVTFIGAEVDLCDLRSVYALTDRLVNGTVGSPDATTAEGTRLPHGSPGTAAYSKDVVQDRWALSEKPGSTGTKRSWGWGLSGLKIPRLDAIICTAGIGGWSGISWAYAVKVIALHMIEETTWPSFKISNVGETVKAHSGGKKTETSTDEASRSLLSSQDDPEPPLGKVFCANVFGHYFLAHGLMPLLSTPASPSSRHGGKIILTSSMEPFGKHLNMDDFQALESIIPYESSKRIIDTIALTSELPSVKKISSPFFDPSTVVIRRSEEEEEGEKLPFVKPTMHVVQPGIFVSDIIEIPSVLVVFYTALFYFIRWIGSPWHTITPDKAAVSSAWVALLDQDELQKIEENGLARAKWGSAINPSGDERVMKTEVPGWGWQGKVDENPSTGRLGRKSDAVDVTSEEIEEFEIQGGKVWEKMEALRKEWEGILGIGVASK